MKSIRKKNIHFPYFQSLFFASKLGNCLLCMSIQIAYDFWNKIYLDFELNNFWSLRQIWKQNVNSKQSVRVIDCNTKHYNNEMPIAQNAYLNHPQFSTAIHFSAELIRHPTNAKNSQKIMCIQPYILFFHLFYSFYNCLNLFSFA